MKERAIYYFRLGEQYAETAKLLLETLIANENSNSGIGKTPEEAYENMENNVSKSDLYLFVPTIFNCMQSIELWVKGLFLLNNINIDKNHKMEKYLLTIKNIYGESSKIYVAIKEFYNNQIGIIKKYMKDNKLENSKELYMALRYPEKIIGNNRSIVIDYTSLLLNGDKGIEQFKLLLDNFGHIKEAILNEYHLKIQK